MDWGGSPIGGGVSFGLLHTGSRSSGDPPPINRIVLEGGSPIGGGGQSGDPLFGGVGRFGRFPITRRPTKWPKVPKCGLRVSFLAFLGVFPIGGGVSFGLLHTQSRSFLTGPRSFGHLHTQSRSFLTGGPIGGGVPNWRGGPQLEGGSPIGLGGVPNWIWGGPPLEGVPN